MKVLVVGTWREEEAREVEATAKEIGRVLAEKNHVLVTGGGEGVSQFVVEGYRENVGEKYIAYLPAEVDMQDVGEGIGPKPDKIMMTNLDYPKRNIKMVKESDAVIALHGGLSTLTEIIHSVKDYDKPVSVIKEKELSDWIECIQELKEKVFLTEDVKEAVSHFEN